MAPERRQLDLRRACAALVATDGGPPTMTAIARTIGLAKPTLYRLAGSRDELVELCLAAEAERLIGHLHEVFREPDGESPAALVEAAVHEFAADSAAGLDLLFGGGFREARASVRRVEDRLSELLRRSATAPEEGGPVAAARLLGAAAAGARRRVEG